jgi:uncharacterized membrane protein YcaP (DUF421 family)
MSKIPTLLKELIREVTTLIDQGNCNTEELKKIRKELKDLLQFFTPVQ